MRREKQARRLGAIFLLMLVAPLAGAQVQRSYLNSSFELPTLTAANPAAGCYKILSSTLVPGWLTTAPSAAESGNCVAPNSPNGPAIELWRTNFNGVAARAGLNFAELNAYVPSRIYQNACLINGEAITYRFSHRARSSAAVGESMTYGVGASSPVVRVTTTSTGAFTAPIVSQGTINAPASGGNGWVDYSGSFTYTGATGLTNLGFESNSPGSVGNFLDNIQIALQPFVEFTQPSSSSPEATGGNLPTLRVNGTTSTPFTVTVQITGGTATSGSDYTTPGNSTTLTVNVPAATYDGVSASSLFALPVTVVNDALAESNETILFSIVPPPPATPPFLLSSSTTCGGAVQATWTYTIVDDDATVTLSKNAGATVPVVGNPAQADIAYTLEVSNPSASTPASYGLVDTPGFDPDASVVSANFTLNGGAPIALTGGGPWTLQPPSKALAPGATDTYVVNVRVAVARGGAVDNDACTSPGAAGSGLHNAARATIPASGGNPVMTFDAGACQRTPTPVWVTLRKTLSGRIAATDQAQVRIFSGGISAASATTSGAGLPATASTGLVVIPAGNTLQFNESIKTNGTGADRPLTGYQPQIACTNAGTSTPNLPSGVGSNTGTSQRWSEFSPAAGADIDCTIANALMAADLAITKTNSVESVVSGSQTTYVIAVSNGGPNAAGGAVLSDPAPTGLQDCVLAAPACTATGGAACPATGTGAGQLSIANLQAAGAVIPVLPNGGQVTVSVTCTVD